MSTHHLVIMLIKVIDKTLSMCGVPKIVKSENGPPVQGE